jgi:hypothetical protein
MNNALTQMKMLEKVVSALSDDLVKDLVFIGGCTTSLFLDQENLSLSTRYTQDVDLIVDIKTTTQWYDLDKKVRELGFRNYQSSDPFEKDTDFTCRYQLGEDLIVDFMPTDESILGFSNSWYLEAYEKKVTYKLSNNLVINTLTPEYFLATKFEAFHGRNEDPLYSKDLEDIITICLGRASLVQEVYDAPQKLRDYLSDEFKKLTELTDFESIMDDQCRFGSKERALQVINAIIKQWPKAY